MFDALKNNVQTLCFVLAVCGGYLYMEGALQRFDDVEERIKDRAVAEKDSDRAWLEYDKLKDSERDKKIDRLLERETAQTLFLLSAIYDARVDTAYRLGILAGQHQKENADAGK